jgi:hypothetical protein
MRKMSKGVVALFLAGLAGLGCTDQSGLKYGGGSSGALGGATGGQAGRGISGILGGSGGAVGSGGLVAGGSGGRKASSGGTSSTGGCIPLPCLALCVSGEFRPNPSDPCGCPICVLNTPDAGATKDARVPDSGPVCGPIACPMLACAGGYLPSPEPCGCPTCPPDAGVAKYAQDAGTRTPLRHRATGAACPAARAPGTNSCNCAGPPGVCMPCAGFPGGCGQDSDCTAGINGRCLDLGPAPIMNCSYDECFGDADCLTNTPCDCRDSISSSAPNSCLTGSNCRVDSDCGPGGFCSPSQASWNELTYDCHTANDTCLNDSDCASNESCVFGQQAGYWSCAVIPPPPP